MINKPPGGSTFHARKALRTAAFYRNTLRRKLKPLLNRWWDLPVPVLERLLVVLEENHALESEEETVSCQAQ